MYLLNTNRHSKSFTAGHIISEKNGGKIKWENIIPICNSCNLSMSATNMDEFIKEYYPNNGDNFIKKYTIKKETTKKMGWIILIFL